MFLMHQGTGPNIGPNGVRRLKANVSRGLRWMSGVGLRGEPLVVKREQQRLTAAGRADLAARVRHVSAVEGDGAGYDMQRLVRQEEITAEIIELAAGEMASRIIRGGTLDRLG
jgi:hypothetical protein